MVTRGQRTRSRAAQHADRRVGVRAGHRPAARSPRGPRPPAALFVAGRATRGGREAHCKPDTGTRAMQGRGLGTQARMLGIFARRAPCSCCGPGGRGGGALLNSSHHLPNIRYTDILLSCFITGKGREEQRWQSLRYVWRLSPRGLVPCRQLGRVRSGSFLLTTAERRSNARSCRCWRRLRTRRRI